MTTESTFYKVKLMPILFAKRYTLNAKKGFTLIELLVVIAIIGILATFVVASFTSAQQRGRDSRRKSDVDAIKKALLLMKGDSTGGAYYPITAEYPGDVTATYIRVVPTDPSTSANYTYAGTGACGAGWPLAGCTTYTLYATLETTTDPDIANSKTRCGTTADAVATHYYVCSE